MLWRLLAPNSGNIDFTLEEAPISFPNLSILTSNICLMNPVTFFYNFINVFGVPQGTKLVNHEITTHAPKQAMVYTVKQQLLSANIKLILAGVVRWEGTQQTLTLTWQQFKWGVTFLSIVTAIK